MIRDDIKAALTSAMKARGTTQVAALRLIQAAIKNRDIEARTGPAGADDDALVTDVLRKMAKQRRESIEMFDSGGRAELAAAERAELAVIESFLPQQLDRAAAEAAVRALAAEIGAASPKDMGRLMAAIKERLSTSIDMGSASGIAKAVLAGG